MPTPNTLNYHDALYSADRINRMGDLNATFCSATIIPSGWTGCYEIFACRYSLNAMSYRTLQTVEDANEFIAETRAIIGGN